MFNIIESWSNFRGCAQREKLWCFDMWTESRQNRTWAVSNLPRKAVMKRVTEYANEHVGECMISLFDPNVPEMLGNFGKWYKVPTNRAWFREACLVESAITEDTPYETRCALRNGAHAILKEVMRETKLKADILELEGTVMRDIVCDIRGY